MIKIKNLSYNYGDIAALNNINLEIKAGLITGILGPNGSGKSTLLSLISRVLIPKKGEIFLNGNNLRDYSHKKLAQNIGFVSQDSIINFPFSCYEIVMMGRYPYLSYLGTEKTKDLSAVQDSMELTRTTHLAKRFITGISGGERQRIILAQVLAQQPKILLLDEPTSHLDIKFQIEILDLLKKLNQEYQLTTIIALHDLNLAGMYCDKIVILKEGEIFTEGAPEEVITSNNISEVWGTQVKVKKSHYGDYPEISLIPKYGVRSVHVT